MILLVRNMGTVVGALAGILLSGFATILSSSIVQAASEWDEIVAKAKQEGKVVMYGVMPTRGTLPAVVRDMKQKYGITVTNMRMHPREAIAKIKAEMAAKTYQVDVIQAGPYTYTLDNLDFFEDPGPLPSLADPKVKWFADPWIYKPMVLTSITGCGITVNTKLVPPGTEPKSWKDLANPKFRGRIIIDDPRRSSIMQTLFALLTPRYGKEWMKRFLIDNKPIIAREIRTVTPQLVRGEWEIYAGSLYRTPRAMLNKTPDLPIAFYYPQEGGIGLIGTQAIVRNAPHPNAARVFVNYLLSQAGQEAYGIGLNIPVRLGTKVPIPEEQDPAKLKFLQPCPPTPEFVRVEAAKHRDLAKEIMGK
ncbi:MAG: ABC transporter substrate-binding protein [Deltaproteobacteria bacterium]|nr:ABC transporter substrate-binding protein [Deltaproteobacteria bacterium]